MEFSRLLSLHKKGNGEAKKNPLFQICIRFSSVPSTYVATIISTQVRVESGYILLCHDSRGKILSFIFFKFLPYTVIGNVKLFEKGEKHQVIAAELQFNRRRRRVSSPDFHTNVPRVFFPFRSGKR